MVDGAKKAMTAAKSKHKLNNWLKTFRRLNAEVPMKPGGSLSSPEAFSTAHNEEYQKFVRKISEGGGYKPQFLGRYNVRSEMTKGVNFQSNMLYSKF